MASDHTSPYRILSQKAKVLYTMGPSLWFMLFLLTPKAYWSRIREGRSPFSSTLSDRGRSLPKVSLAGRTLSQEPYLRPTAHCNSHAPEVVALADELRRHAESDWDYAQAIFDFARNEIVHGVEPAPRDGVVGILKRGYGICVDKVNVFVALARAGGLPARYCSVNVITTPDATSEILGGAPPLFRIYKQVFEELEAETDPLLKKIGVAARRFLRQLENAVETRGISWDLTFHPIAEVQINRVWIPADPTWDDDECAAFDLPLPRLGYQPVILRTLKASVSGRSEAVPVRRSVYLVRRLSCLMARGTIDYLNRSLEVGRARGRQILAEVGKDTYIRRFRRFYLPVPEVMALGVPLASYPNA